jgi:hypothetical protein
MFSTKSLLTNSRHALFPLHKQPVSSNSLTHLVMLWQWGASLANLVRKCLWTTVTDEVFACSSTQYIFALIHAPILKSAPLVSISEMSILSVLPNATWRVSFSCYICICGINSLQPQLCFLFVPFILNWPVYYIRVSKLFKLQKIRKMKAVQREDSAKWRKNTPTSSRNEY